MVAPPISKDLDAIHSQRVDIDPSMQWVLKRQSNKYRTLAGWEFGKAEVNWCHIFLNLKTHGDHPNHAIWQIEHSVNWLPQPKPSLINFTDGQTYLA